MRHLKTDLLRWVGGIFLVLTSARFWKKLGTSSAVEPSNFSLLSFFEVGFPVPLGGLALSFQLAQTRIGKTSPQVDIARIVCAYVLYSIFMATKYENIAPRAIFEQFRGKCQTLVRWRHGGRTKSVSLVRRELRC